MKKLVIAETVGLVFGLIAGTVLHFVYKWSGYNDIVALFAPINESVWEHLKLLFFPFILYAAAEYYIIGNKYTGFFTAKAFAAILGILSLLAMFYTYTAIAGKNFLFADITIFVISNILMYVFGLSEIPNENSSNKKGIAIIAVITFIFFVFTVYPPQGSLFTDPLAKENTCIKLLL